MKFKDYKKAGYEGYMKGFDPYIEWYGWCARLDVSKYVEDTFADAWIEGWEKAEAEEKEEEKVVQMFPIVDETYMSGNISIDNWQDHLKLHGQQVDLGIQIARDGRVWICVNGVSFIRFNPNI